MAFVQLLLLCVKLYHCCLSLQRRAVHCLLDAVDTIRDRGRIVFVIASAPSSLDVRT